MTLAGFMLGFAMPAVVAYGGLVATLYVAQRSFIYIPTRVRPDLAAAGVPGVREVSLATKDGLTLLAWFLPPPRPEALTAVYFHGNAGNIAVRAGRLRRFAAAGWGVLLVEYRGYGGNPGAPSEAGLLADGRAALDFLRGQEIMPRRTVIYGESLGTGVAVPMAVALDPGPAALVLESPFTSLVAAARAHFPYIPVSPLLKDRFMSIDRIAQVHVPLFVAQAGHDRVVPPAQGRALFAAASEPKELWLAPDAGHNDLEAFGVIEAATGFVARHRPAS